MRALSSANNPNWFRRLTSTTIIAAFIAAAGAIIAGYIQKSPSATAQPKESEYKVQGYIFKAGGSEAIGNVKVTSMNSGAINYSDDNGFFSITLKGSVPEQIELKASKIGYTPRIETVNPSTVLRIYLEPLQ